MAGSRIKTPSRPDLNSIFNTKQRKPRSSQPKPNRSQCKQQPAIVQGDLLELYAAKVDRAPSNLGNVVSDNNTELLSAKRSRPSGGEIAKVARRRIDSSPSSRPSLVSPTVDNISPAEVDSSNTITSHICPPTVDPKDDLVLKEPDIAAVRGVEALPAEKSAKESCQPEQKRSVAPQRQPRLTRSQLLLKSAVDSGRAPKFVDVPRFRTPEASPSTEGKPDPIEKLSINHTTTTDAEWAATARRLITPQLHLPIRLQNLKEVFKAVETTMNVHKARRRISVPFPELRSGVESIIKKTFTKSYLAQIVHLFPHGYLLHYKQTRNSESGRNENVIMITMLEIPGSGRLNQLQKNQHRLDQFHDCLLKFVFAFYSDWITERHPSKYDSIQSSGLYSLAAWDPGFPLERCPSVPLCKLPEPPPSASSAELARLVGGGEAEREAAAEVETKLQALPPEEKITLNDIPRGLEGVPLSLIQKVRIKEASARKLSEQIGTQQRIHSDVDLDSLPDFVVLVHGIFSALGKPSMLFSAFIAQLKFKLKAQFVSEGSILNRVNLLLEFLPRFCQKVTEGRIEAFRVDLTANLAHLRAELRYAIKQKKASRDIATNSSD